MGCPCESSDTCGCFFAASGDVVASGTGAEDNPMVLTLAAGKLPVAVGLSGDPPTFPAVGQLFFETDTLRLRVWTGSKWRLVNQIAGGGQSTSGGNSLINSTAGDAATLNYVHPFTAFDNARLDFIARVQVTGTDGDRYTATVADNVGGAYGAVDFVVAAGQGSAAIPAGPAIVSTNKTFRIALAKFSGTSNGVTVVTGDLKTHLGVVPTVIN